MIKKVFDQQDLPLEDLQKIHLENNGELLLDRDDLDALLSGRRTDMLRLENLEMDAVLIKELDAKLSLQLQPDGNLKLLLHPIHLEPEVPSFLNSTQAEMLEKGDIVNLQTMIFDYEGSPKEVLVEFDKDTNEFIVTDTEKIQAPAMVNGIPLTAEEKERYKKGKEVEVADGTTFQYSGTEKQGMRSDKLALVASILIDGGVSYLLYQGLNALLGKKEEENAKRGFGRNYHAAVQDMQRQEARDFTRPVEDGPSEEYSETVSR